MTLSNPRGKLFASSLVVLLCLAALVVAFSDPRPRALNLPEPAVYTKGPGPEVGTKIPAFRLQDQKGQWRDFASLVGPRGALLLFFRSADW